MTFNADQALKKARASVHGFYFDGPSNAERRVKTLEGILSLMFRQERKLKLERLMWKAKFKANRLYDMSDLTGNEHYEHRGDRWISLMRDCKKELEKMK